MDFQELISYTHELQLENKQLKKHIFNIQQQLNEKGQLIQLITQKKDELAEHIRKCQNQIIKREEREIGLISNADSLARQIDIYLQQINRMKQVVNSQKQESQNNKLGNKVMKLPPKSNARCKNCDSLTLQRDSLYMELQRERQKTYVLSRDLQCVIGTFCTEE